MSAMKSRRKITHLLVFVGVIVFFLLSYTIRLPNQTSIAQNPSIYIDFSKFSRQQVVDLRILVLTYNRHKSMLRLLNSLNEAHYFGESIAIEVWIDRSKDGMIDRLTYEVASSFVFEKGNMFVFNQSRHVGIYGQWMGTWPTTYPSKEIAVILEDDMIVSPIFYRYLKAVHLKYGSYDNINGFALHCSMNHYTGDGVIDVPGEHLVFLYPIIGTWGFSPKIKHWIQFTNWYRSIYKDTNFRPFVPNIIPSQWYKSLLETGRADSMWSMWHIYYSWLHKHYTLYPNFPNCSSLTRNFRERGLHFSEKSFTIDKMVTNWNVKYDDLPNTAEVVHQYT